MNENYKKLFTEIIKKQMMILGPEVVVSKVKSVHGILIDKNGEVLVLKGDPKELLVKLINQFYELSGSLVKETIEPLFLAYPEITNMVSFNKPQNKDIESIPVDKINGKK